MPARTPVTSKPVSFPARPVINIELLVKFKLATKSVMAGQFSTNLNSALLNSASTTKIPLPSLKGKRLIGPFIKIWAFSTRPETTAELR